MNDMNFLDLVKARYSVRSYRPQAVEREKVEYLLECARLAPSAVNFQPWRFFVVASDACREALRRCYHREWFAEAPLCIAVCVDESVSWKRKSDGHDHADIDAAIAAEHICLAAAEQGIGELLGLQFRRAALPRGVGAARDAATRRADPGRLSGRRSDAEETQVAGRGRRMALRRKRIPKRTFYREIR